MKIESGSTTAVARLPASAVFAIALLGAGAAGAADIRLLSAAAMQSVFKQIVAEFERTSAISSSSPMPRSAA